MSDDDKNSLCLRLSIALLVFVLLQHTANSESSDSTPDTITVCDGEAASFSWPCDLAYDHAKVMTLTFKGFSAKGQLVASIDASGKVKVLGEYLDRVIARGTSGVRLHSVGILDSGVYWTTATFSNGTVLERPFTLNVQVPPLLVENGLKVAVTTTRGSCQSIICGTVRFPGFPAVAFSWQTPGDSIPMDSPEGTSRVEGCPLLPGNYTCRVMGAALTCAKHLPASVDAESSSASVVLGDTGQVKESTARQRTKEQILVIVIPILAIMTPLVILAVWVVSHMLSGCSCGSQDIEEGSSSSALLGSPSLPSPNIATSDLACEEAGGDRGSGGHQADGADHGEQEETADEDVADPTVPLMDPEIDVSVGFVDDEDGGETNL